MLNSKNSNFGLTETTFAVIRRFNQDGLSRTEKSLIAQLHTMLWAYVAELENYNPYNQGATTDVVAEVITAFWKKISKDKVRLSSLKSLLKKMYLKKGVDIYRKETNAVKLVRISDEIEEQAQAKRVSKTISFDLVDARQSDEEDICYMDVADTEDGFLSFEVRDDSNFKKRFVSDMLNTVKPEVRETMIACHFDEEPLTQLAAQRGITQNCLSKQHLDARKKMSQHKNIYERNCCY